MEQLQQVSIVFTIYDTKSKTWSEPQVHDDEKSFKQFASVMVNLHSNGPMHKYPEDFIVYEMGTFNQLNGLLNVYDEKVPMYALSTLQEECSVCSDEVEKQEELLNE